MTGGTGLMGKVLVEKILRCCPDVEKIYILLRPKKCRTIQQRWEEITTLPVFDRLRKTNLHSFNKVHVIRGDIGEDNLGLSEEDTQILLDKVTIVYHGAAMIQFTDNINELLNKNTKATYILLGLAKRMVNLQLFLYVSTAFSNMNIPCDQAEENVIPACQDWRVMLKVLDREPLALGGLREKLMCGHPNAYTWSKSMAENIVHEHRNLFPTVIIRPAILNATYQEPFGGWADIICGIAATAVPVGLGMMRVVYTRDESFVDYIPIDTAVNALMIASWKKTLEPREGETDVYNCAVAKQVPLRSSALRDNAREVLEEYTSKNVVWPMHTIFTTNDNLYYILFILLQVIPAAIMDLILLLLGKKPMILNLTKKVKNIARIFKVFSAGKIAFPNDKYLELEKYVSEKDKTFTISVEGLTNKHLMKLGMRAVLLYIFKEDLSQESIKKNKRRVFWLNIIDKCLIFTFYLTCGWLVFRYLASFESLRTAAYIAHEAFWRCII